MALYYNGKEVAFRITEYPKSKNICIWLMDATKRTIIKPITKCIGDNRKLAPNTNAIDINMRLWLTQNGVGKEMMSGLFKFNSEVLNQNKFN